MLAVKFEEKKKTYFTGQLTSFHLSLPLPICRDLGLQENIYWSVYQNQSPFTVELRDTLVLCN